MKTMKKILKIIGALVLVLALAVGGYAVYLFADYSRLPDHQELLVTQRTEAVLAAGEAKSIVSWNLGFGAYSADFSFFMDGGDESRARSLRECEANILGAVDNLKMLDADFMLIQELDEAGDRSHGLNQRLMLEEAFSDSHSAVFAQNYDSSYLFYPIHAPIGAARSGILTLGNVRMDGALRRSLPIESGFNKFFDLDRCYSVTRIPVDNGRQLCLYNLHLSAYTSDGSIAVEQLKMMAADMQGDYAEGNYVIAGGDFNKDLWGDSSAYSGVTGVDASWCQPFPLETLPDGFVLVDSLDENDPVFSCRNADAPYQQGVSFVVTLDGFIVSDNVEVISCGVVDAGFAVSDHNPVRMEFVLQA